MGRIPPLFQKSLKFQAFLGWDLVGYHPGPTAWRVFFPMFYPDTIRSGLGRL